MLYPVELRAQENLNLAGKLHFNENSGRGREIRTPDPLLPKQMRYQTALCPDRRGDDTGQPDTGQ